MNIDTIIFDLGAVLINWNPYPVILKSFDNNDEKTQWFLKNICDHEWNLSLDKGKKFYDAKLEKTGEYPAYAKQISVYLDRWEEMLGPEIPGTVSIFKSLYLSKQYRLFSITNWSYETFPIALSRFPFLKWFEDIVVSGEVKMVKPDLEIYEYSIKRFEIDKPENSIFIDDRLENIESANRSGLKGILFQNPDQLILELQKYGVNSL